MLSKLLDFTVNETGIRNISIILNCKTLEIAYSTV